MRDTQQTKLYKAEDTVLSHVDIVPFTTLAEAQALLDDVLRPVFFDTYDDKKIRVEVTESAKRDRSTHNPVTPDHHLIELSPAPDHMNSLVLAHEYTHGIVRRSVPSHGADFARRYLDVVSLLSPALADALHSAFDRAKLVVDPHHQWNAARNQVLRLRSDVGATGDRKSTKALPIQELIYAERADDFDGETYKHVFSPYVEAKDTHGDGLAIEQYDGWLHITWRQLRYIEGAMVRVR